jgi:hypothetical protein
MALLLKNIVQTQPEKMPPRILLHGKHGLGKSSWAAKSPKPIFIQTEDGLGEIKVDRFPLSESVDEVFQNITMLIKEDHQYKTCVIDTLDWFETLAWKKICKERDVKNIEDVGYAKGYSFAMHYHDKLIKGLTILRNKKNMAILMLAHNEIKPFQNPEGENWDTYMIKLHKKAAKKYEEFSDAVLFLNHKTYVTKGKGELKAKAIGSDERAIFTKPRPAFSAKCRYKKVPYEIPFPEDTGFTNFLKLIKNGGNNI